MITATMLFPAWVKECFASTLANDQKVNDAVNQMGARGRTAGRFRI
jgi:hypothetical protein